MSFVELLLVAVGLSMDAFAVSVCKGLSVKGLGVKRVVVAGAGFGGCTISIVKKSAVEGFIRHVDKAYFDAIGYRASFYETSLEDGITVSKL
mgnify:CR=1 FL=1